MGSQLATVQACYSSDQQPFWLAPWQCLQAFPLPLFETEFFHHTRKEGVHGPGWRRFLKITSLLDKQTA
jgi:hypothetical protein